MKLPTAAVLAIVTNNKHEILFVKQKTGPFRGRWLLPGSRVKLGEKVRDAVVRELAEETRLSAETISFLGIFDVIEASKNCHFNPIVFLCEAAIGEVKAGSDALGVKWLNPDALENVQKI